MNLFAFNLFLFAIKPSTKKGYTNLCSAKIILSGTNRDNTPIVMSIGVGFFDSLHVKDMMQMFMRIDHKNQKRHKNISSKKLMKTSCKVMLLLNV